MHLTMCGAGIMASLVVYSILQVLSATCGTAYPLQGEKLCFLALQERIMTGSFGDAGRFRWSVFLVLCNRLMTSSLAIGVLAVSTPA